MEMMAELQLYKLIVKIKVVYNNYCTNHVKRFQTTANDDFDTCQCRF